MVNYLRRLVDVPAFSNIPLPGHAGSKVVNKILIDLVTGSQNFMLLWASAEPGSETALHTHPVEQAYFVLSGELLFRMAGVEHKVGSDTAVLIPSGMEHGLEIVSREAARVLTIFAPPLPEFASRPH